MTPYDEFAHLAARALTQNHYGEAIKVASQGLKSHPGNPALLSIMGQAFLDNGQFYEGSLVLEAALAVDNTLPGVWGALAKCYGELGPYEDEYYEKAISAARSGLDLDPEDPSGFVTLSYVELQRTNYDKAFEYAQNGLKLKNDSNASMFNMAIAMLANHMWEEGWFCYDKSLKPRYQKGIPDYGLPLWEGQPGKVIISGEQGLGDEIMFSSMIPELKKDADIIVDTDPRLAGLFSRSFHCAAFGTKGDDAAPWKRFTDAEYWLPMGSLGAFYRSDPELFTGKPYLKADPERQIQWRALFDKISDKPKVGIAWSGGIPKTGESFRSLTIEQLAPILEYDVEWVSLQYKNTDDVPYYMHHWARATEAESYEETAALIAELDLVISVQTTAVHCAGALGKETLCLLSNRPQWRYGADGAQMPWYNSVRLLRQSKDGLWPFDEVKKRLDQMGVGKVDRKAWDLPPIIEGDHVAMAMAG